MKTHAAAAAALLTLAAALTAGCSPSKPAAGAGGQDKYAGLEQEMPRWRQEILSGNPLCGSQAEGEKCEGFEVTCKAERTVTPQDQAQGVTARVVASMTWNGFDPKFKHAQSGVSAVEFTRGPNGWTRAEHKPVNPETCADL